jgi:hypothetical protein
VGTGGFFVIQSACGLIGDFAVGGAEIISHDSEAGCHRTPFFDSQGNTTGSQLRLVDGVWTWTGTQTRFSDDRTIQTAHQAIFDRERLITGTRRPALAGRAPIGSAGTSRSIPRC